MDEEYKKSGLPLDEEERRLLRAILKEHSIRDAVIVGVMHLAKWITALVATYFGIKELGTELIPYIIEVF